MPFDEEDLDPHGECRHEIRQLTDRMDKILAENIEMRRTFGSHPLFAEKDAIIADLRSRLDASDLMWREGALREGNLLNALHEIAELDKHGGYNSACHRARAAIAANKT